jgi:nucleoside 2-deoxyribosyltransferase
MQRIYLAGPMTGLPELNFPLFHRVAKHLRECGFCVINPAEINADPTKHWAACMRDDIKHLMTCDGIAMLPGWEASKGASLELHIATQLDFTVTFLP